MPTRGRAFYTAVLAAVLLPGCDVCLYPPCRVLDSIEANVRLCGFPLEQIDHSGEVSKGVLRVGQQILLRLEGDRDRMVSVAWSVNPPAHAPNPPHVTFERRSNAGAILVGLAPGGNHPADYVWASAHLAFVDGTESVAVVAYCRGDSDWSPANHIVVR
jgi:hypothetical protein